MLKLASLELLHALELHFGNIISVHVHEDIFDHDDAQLLLLPNLICLFKEILIASLGQAFHYRSQQLNRGVLDSVIE